MLQFYHENQSRRARAHTDSAVCQLSQYHIDSHKHYLMIGLGNDHNPIV